MSAFKVGDRVQFNRVFMHKGMFVTAMSPKQVKAVRESGSSPVYDVVFLDAEGNPHLIENVKEAELQTG